jgi:FixJ family two-component response regulator
VVLGLQIQGTAGLELQEALSRSEEPLPVIFVTAHRGISSSVRAMKQGAVDVLSNPVWVMSCSKRCSGHSPGAPPSGKRS